MKTNDNPADNSQDTGETMVDHPIDPAPATDMGGMDSNEICVDLQSLSMPDEDDQMQAPAVGDMVQANIEGTVSRIEGDKAYVMMSAVNGQKVKEQGPAPTDMDEESTLRQMAAAQPDRY